MAGSGLEIDDRVKMFVARSKTELRYNAASTPSTSAKGTAIAALTAARNIVLAKRGAICCATLPAP